MALSNVKNVTTAAPAAAPTTAPEAPAAAPKAGKKGNGNAENFRNLGASLRAKMTEEEKTLEGSKSDKVAFVCTLGDPSRPQKRRSNGQDKPSLQVVGYALKILEDMEVPYAPLKQGFTSMVDCEPIQWKPAKAGETVYLNNLETGTLISQPQFAGSFTGEGTSVSLSIKFSSDRPDPLPILQKNGEGSIKENMMPIAENKGTETAKRWEAKEGFEKFSVLWVKKSAGSRGSAAARKKNDAPKDLAAAFTAFMNKKNA